MTITCKSELVSADLTLVYLVSDPKLALAILAETFSFDLFGARCYLERQEIKTL